MTVHRALDRRRRHQAGFTLIELLVVIIILGVLSTVVVFAVRSTGDKGQSAAIRTDARTMRTAEEAYRARPGGDGKYGDEQDLVDAKFLSEHSSIHDVVLADDATSYLLTFQPGPAASGGTLVVGETFVPPTNASAGGALTWNPASDTSGSTHAFWEIMYNGLLELDAAGNPHPELATRVPTTGNGDISQSGRVYRLLLRDDVFWHDSGAVTPTNPSGAARQFTADDVIYTFEKVLLRFHARTRNMGALLNPPYDLVNHVATGIAKCTVAELANPGDDPNFCVAFHFTDPYAPLLRQLNVTEAAMTPKHVLCATGCSGPGVPSLTQLVANRVGTGPFRCEVPLTTPIPCRDGNNSADSKVVKNPTYWRTGFPYLDAIVMRSITNATQRTNALVAGSVDWVWDVEEIQANTVATNPRLRTLPTQSLGGGPNSIDQIIFNLWDQGATVAQIAATPNPTATPHPILGNADLVDPDGPGPEPAQSRGLLVRRAVSHAVDRAGYLATRGNVGSIATAPISSELSAHAGDITLPSFDQAKAGVLLQAAGWVDSGGPFRQWGLPTGGGLTNSQNLALSFVCQSDTNCARVDTIKAQLLPAKIDIQKIDCRTTVPCGGVSANVRVFTNRDFDLFILNYAQGYDPHVGVRRQYHRDQITDASAGSVPNNAAGYRNAVVDAAFDNAVKTIDPAARFDQYHNFQLQAAKDLPYVWVIETPNVRGATVRCSGLREWTGQFAEYAACRR